MFIFLLLTALAPFEEFLVTDFYFSLAGTSMESLAQTPRSLYVYSTKLSKSSPVVSVMSRLLSASYEAAAERGNSA